jgi:hypothetical protein
MVLLADARWRWQPQQPEGQTLWQCFRLAYLGTVWALRGSGLLQPQRVVDMVVRALSTGVQRDWQRVVTNVLAAAVGLVPTTWFRGRDPQLKEKDFKDLWPAGGLGGWYEVGEGQGGGACATLFLRDRDLTGGEERKRKRHNARHPQRTKLAGVTERPAADR